MLFRAAQFLLALAALTDARSAVVPARVRLDDSILAVPAAASVAEPHRVRDQLTQAELSEQLNFIITLRLRGFEELESRIAAHQVVPAAEMEASYLPAAADYARVRAWLKQNGFTLTLDDASHTNVFARGSIAQIAAALKVSFARVATAEREFSSAVTAPSLPADIAGAVLAVNGLQPHLRAGHRPHVAEAAAGLGSPNGSPTPGDIAYAYSVPSTMTGAGQTIAIIGDAVPLSSDLTTFWSICGIPQSLSNFSVVNVNGGASSSGDPFEATLDVEWASAMAPGAAIRFYAIPDYLYSDITAAATQVLNDLPKCPSLHALSISIVGPENLAGSATILKSYSQVYAQLAAAGVSVFACSGDGGSNPDPDLTNRYQSSYPLTVEYPASDPNLTAVGGTALSFSASWVPTGEAVWYNVAEPGSSGTVASGGGFSAIFQRPATQSGTGVPAGTARCVPDVAAQANSAFMILNGLQYTSWGTSVATPIWAGICADMNQVRAAYGLAPLGLIGPWVYPLIGTNGLTDITFGANGAYSAGPGYDLCTGVGTPQVRNLIGLINATVAEVRAPSGITAAGTAVTMSIKPQLASTYQWYLNGVAVAGATTGTYTLPAAGVANSGAYTVVVSNALGNSTYPLGTLTVVAPPAFLTQPLSQTVATGSTVVFSASASTGAYQWYCNGAPIAGATNPTLLVANAAASATYRCQVSNSAGSVSSQPASLTVTTTANPGRIQNLSVNAFVTASGLTMGFISGGSGTSGPQNLLIRAAGPALSTLGISHYLADPTVTVFDQVTSAAVAHNAGWGATASNAAAVLAAEQVTAAFAWPSVASADSAVVASLPENGSGYSVDVAGQGGDSGTTVAEVYDDTSNYVATSARLINLSCRQLLPVGGTLTAGFTIGGATSKTVLIRAMGPTLASFGLSPAMPDPQLSLYALGDGTPAAANAGWAGDPTIDQVNHQVYAFSPASRASLDAELVLTLAPGAYTVQANSVSGAGGLVQVEIFEVP